MFTVLSTTLFRPRAGQLPWLVVEPENRVALAIENVLSKLGWSIVGPIRQPDKALPLARYGEFAGAVLDLNAGASRVYPLAMLLARRRIPFVFITEIERADLPEEFRDRPSLSRRFLMERLRPLLRGLVAA